MSRTALCPSPAAEMPAPALRIIESVPERHGVIAATARDHCTILREGEVAVYDELDCEPVDGGLFVLEFQRPRAGMTWEIMRRMESERVQVSRNICQITRSERGWWIHPISHHGRRLFGLPIIYMSDGPYTLDRIGNLIIGRVVGVYQLATGGC